MEDRAGQAATPGTFTITATRGTVVAGGALAAGTYTYRVSTVVPDGAGTRETYAGYASSTTIAAADVTASFVVHRAYYQMTRLLAFVYVIGGFAEAHSENGVAVPAGPTALIERHQQ